MSRTWLVLGGGGFIGQAVVAQLVAAGDQVITTVHHHHPEPLPARVVPLDLAQPDAAARLWAAIEQPIAGVACCASARDVADAWAVQIAAPLGLARHLIAQPSSGQPRTMVLLGGLLPGQSLPMDPALAAVQGAISGLVMALGRELGPQGLRVNGVALGLLDGGAAERIPPSQREDYLRFAALRRVGTAAEVAATVVWLLRENTILNGKMLASNGGV